MLRVSAVLFSLVLLGGCARGTWALPELTRAERAGDLASPDATPPYAEPPPAADASVFLFAASQRAANHAEEVRGLRRLFEARGVGPEAIRCYWARPTDDNARADRPQWDGLAGELAQWQPASPSGLAADLAAAAADPPEAVFLYVTGHGAEPGWDRAYWTFRWRKDPERLRAAYPELFAYAIETDATAVGTRSHAQKRHLFAAGHDPADLFLTPRRLAEMLRVFPASTRKIVVLQACHAGGFLGDPGLAAVPNAVAVAAARADRASFGCNSGNRMTVFGASFGAALQADPGRGLDADWRSVFERTRARVESEEGRLGFTGRRHSLPQWLETGR